MDGICEICGATLFMWGNAGEWVWLCPRRYDGCHPSYVTFTSNGTAPRTATAHHTIGE